MSWFTKDNYSHVVMNKNLEDFLYVRLAETHASTSDTDTEACVVKSINRKRKLRRVIKAQAKRKSHLPGKEGTNFPPRGCLVHFALNWKASGIPYFLWEKIYQWLDNWWRSLKTDMKKVWLNSNSTGLLQSLTLKPASHLTGPVSACFKRWFITRRPRTGISPELLL